MSVRTQYTEFFWVQYCTLCKNMPSYYWIQQPRRPVCFVLIYYMHMVLPSLARKEIYIYIYCCKSKINLKKRFYQY